MQRKLIYSFCLILSIIFAFSLTAKAGPKVNLIAIEKGTIDLGKIKEGQRVKDSFLIENSGDSPLILRSIQPSCSCLEVIKPEDRISIAPGKRQKIIFSFDSTGYSDLVKQFLYLETNIPTQKIITLEITADVVRAAFSLKERFQQFSPLVIIGNGLIDGINPCAFTVIVFFMSFLFFVGYRRKEVFIVGTAFILAVFITYLLIGLGLFSTLRHLGEFVKLSRILYYITAAIAFFLGFLSLIDFWQLKTSKSPEKMILRLPQILKNKITRVINERLDRRRRTFKDTVSLVAAAFSCGIIVSLLESACTGQMYLPTIVFMLKNSDLKIRALLYLLVYNIMFILPLIGIFLLAAFGIKSDTFKALAQRHLAAVKLATALLFFLLGALLLIIV